MATTLRYGYEVRDAKSYFEDIPPLKLPDEMVQLAEHNRWKYGHHAATCEVRGAPSLTRREVRRSILAVSRNATSLSRWFQGRCRYRNSGRDQVETLITGHKNWRAALWSGNARRRNKQRYDYLD